MTLSPELCSLVHSPQRSRLLLRNNWVRLHQTPWGCCAGTQPDTAIGFNTFLRNPHPPELQTVLKPQKFGAWCLERSVRSGCLRVLWRQREHHLSQLKEEPRLCREKQLGPTTRPKDMGMALEKHPVIFATYLSHND